MPNNTTNTTSNEIRARMEEIFTLPPDMPLEALAQLETATLIAEEAVKHDALNRPGGAVLVVACGVDAPWIPRVLRPIHVLAVFVMKGWEPSTAILVRRSDLRATLERLGNGTVDALLIAASDAPDETFLTMIAVTDYGTCVAVLARHPMASGGDA